jgi:RNA polymerase-binding transcription factor DksA
MTERTSDSSDLASLREAEANEQALARQRAKESARIRATQIAINDGDFDGEHCIECDVELPAERIADHRMLCTVCQSAVERQKKMRGEV